MRGFMGAFKAVKLPVRQPSACIIEPTVVGDGVTDDTAAVQAALTTASNSGLTFRTPAGKNCRITGILFVWGAANMTSAPSSSLVLDIPSANPYLIHFGISAKLTIAAPYIGRVAGLNMSVINGVTGVGGTAGRVLYMWRAIGNVIDKNTLNVGVWPYSLTGSGNNAAYVASASDCIRKNITVCRNDLNATANNLGGEGLGFDTYDGVRAYDNALLGVGDDAIGVHFCTNFSLLRNRLSSVDGRIFISCSQYGEIAYNTHTRIASLRDGVAYAGIALIYIGFESYSAPGSRAAPESIWVHHNTLIYNAQAIDLGAAIFLLGARSVTVEDNGIVNNAAGGSAFALHIQNADFTGTWTDPSGRDPTDAAFPSNVLIQRNVASGSRPLGFVQTGPGAKYIAPIDVNNNTGASFSFYAPATQENNTVI